LTGRNLWYVRCGGKVTGPFPSQVVTNHALWGRINPDDEVSLDQTVWQPLVEVSELLPHELLQLHTETDPEQRQWLEERLKAARRWGDERTHDERRLHELEAEDARRGDERRKATANPDELALPHHHALSARTSTRWGYFILVLIAAAVLLAFGLFYFKPVNPLKVGVIPLQPQCKQTATPRLNWSGCAMEGVRLRGVDLSGSDLSYTNFFRADLSGSRLRQAKLVGANLGEANLNHADFAGADLSNADLRGANLVEATLTGAVFDHAIWPDGQICELGSIGQCR
jgi:hypothetical protein